MDAAEDVAFGLYRTGTEQLSAESVNCVKPYVVNVQLGRGQINCKMEVDTGASRSTGSKYVYDAELSDYRIQPVRVILRNYSGEKIPAVGKITVPVKYENQEHIFDLIVVEGNLPALFGRDWLSRIRVDWKNVFNVKVEATKNEISIPKSETFPAQCNNVLEEHKMLLSTKGLVSKVLRDP